MGRLEDWVELTVRAGLPPPTADFQFNPKHKSNSYVKPEDLAKVGHRSPDSEVPNPDTNWTLPRRARCRMPMPTWRPRGDVVPAAGACCGGAV